MDYKSAGVDIDLAESLVKYIQKSFPEVGGFSGKIRMGGHYIGSTTDGVGTKILVARDFSLARKDFSYHKNIGIDLVAMNVNDLLPGGFKPLFFLDYVATSSLKETLEPIKMVLRGIKEALKESGAVLLGGETAEMPDFYPPHTYDLAGFAVGIAKKKELLPQKVEKGDVLIGLKSSGVHSNGLSLVRKILEKNQISYTDEAYDGKSWGDEILKPTRIYVRQFLKVRKYIKAAAHITGGGLEANLSRVVKNFKIFWNWETPKIFCKLMEISKVETKEARRTFNMGIGFVMAVPRKHEKKVLDIFEKLGEEPLVIGEVL